MKDFNREHLPLLIFGNWRGFAGGMKGDSRSGQRSLDRRNGRPAMQDPFARWPGPLGSMSLEGMLMAWCPTKKFPCSVEEVISIAGLGVVFLDPSFPCRGSSHCLCERGKHHGSLQVSLAALATGCEGHAIHWFAAR